MRDILGNLFIGVIGVIFGIFLKFVVMATMHDLDIYKVCEYGEVVEVFEFLDKDNGDLVYLEAYVLDEECEKGVLTND